MQWTEDGDKGEIDFDDYMAIKVALEEEEEQDERRVLASKRAV